MNQIIKKYNLFVRKYHELEKKTSSEEIHDKRVLLRKIFPILSVFKMNPSKVKNGEKAFILFGKLRRVQVQLLTMKTIDQTVELAGYLEFLTERELKLTEKAIKFCEKKALKFPAIQKNSLIDKTKLVRKAEKSLLNLIKTINSHSIDDAVDIQNIRTAFKKFRYQVEVLSYIGNVDEATLDLLKMYQDKLSEIHDYEVLISGIRKYCKKQKLDAEDMTEIFEKDQDRLIQNFENHIELFVLVCREVIGMKSEQPDFTTDADRSSTLQRSVESVIIRAADPRESITVIQAPENNDAVYLKSEELTPQRIN